MHTDPTTVPAETFAQSLERTLARLKSRTTNLMQGSIVAGAVTLSTLLGLSGCGETLPQPQSDPNDPNANQNAGKSDWAQQQGQHNPAMVNYAFSWWNVYTNPGGRFGYQGVDVIVKLRVKPVVGANLSQKHVGVEWRHPDMPSQTAVGTYFTTLSDGYEEWHVTMALTTYEPHPVLFDCWYQDGLGNTYYDDNNGELYPVAYDGSYSVVRQDYETALSAGPSGVQGTVVMDVADLDYSKDLRIRYSTDGWQTSQEMVIGSSSQPNTLFYVSDLGTGIQKWQANVNLPGPVTQLQYALLYRQGVVNNAIPTEFWDNNNGQNYLVQAP